jgi:hypothetical protein
MYSSSVLVKLISRSTIVNVELSLSPRWTRASATLINMKFLYALGVGFLGKDNNTSDWLDLFYAWIKSPYLVNILLMIVFRSNLHVFLSYLECSFLFVQSTSHFLQLLYNLSLLICNL